MINDPCHKYYMVPNVLIRRHRKSWKGWSVTVLNNIIIPYPHLLLHNTRPLTENRFVYDNLHAYQCKKNFISSSSIDKPSAICICLCNFSLKDVCVCQRVCVCSCVKSVLLCSNRRLRPFWWMWRISNQWNCYGPDSNRSLTNIQWKQTDRMHVDTNCVFSCCFFKKPICSPITTF